MTVPQSSPPVQWAALFQMKRRKKMTKKYLRISGFGLLTLFFLALSSQMAFAHGGYSGGWGMGPGMMGGWGMGWWGFIPMLLFLGLIIAAIVLFIKWLAKGSGKSLSGHSSDSGSLEILKERFARGEITKEESEEMKKVMIV